MSEMPQAEIASDLFDECAKLRDENEKLQQRIDSLKGLVMTLAPSFQGGNSRDGRLIADDLGIPFPVSVPDLLKLAESEGRDPDILWPWLKQVRATA